MLYPKPCPASAISNEVQLDALLRSHPKVMALTSSKHHNARKAAAKAQKKRKDMTLGDDECLVLIDTGSNVNGINVGSVIPQCLPHVRVSEAQKHGDTATTARGGKLAHEGKVDVSVSIDGEVFDIELSNIKTEIPILSVRRMLREKSRVIFEQEGGEIV